jgi:hypothetical protein
VFQELEKMEILTFIPEDDENSSIDDEYCLASAEYFHTAIISRDKFADHEKKYPIGVKRRIKFSFQRQKNDRDVMMQNRFDFSNVFLNDKSIESMLRDFENNG